MFYYKDKLLLNQTIYVKIFVFKFIHDIIYLGGLYEKYIYFKTNIVTLLKELEKYVTIIGKVDDISFHKKYIFNYTR